MKNISIPLLTLTFFLFSSLAFADEGALKFAKSRQEAIIASGWNSGLEIDKTLDYDVLIINSMGSNWDSASESQKEEIKSSLKTIIRSSLQKRFKKIPSKKVKWNGFEDQDYDLTIVKSAIEYTKPISESFEIDYLVRKTGSSYKIVDVVFDGVSTVNNYKHQFDKLIRKKGMDALVQKLKERAAQSLIDDDDGC